MSILKLILKGTGIVSLFGFVFLVGILLTDKIVMPRIVRHGSDVIAPDITERSFDEAEHILREIGLMLIEESKVYDPVVPEGYVISQKPRAYTKVKKGRRIHVVVSRGSERLTVLDVTRGISLRQAEIELKSAGFELGSVHYQSSEDIPKGVVMSQSPPPNTTASRGALINVTVSSGPVTGFTVVPELIGLSLEAAVVELQEVGLEVGEIEYVQQKELLPETVLGQSLESGEEVERGSRVHLTVTE